MILNRPSNLWLGAATSLFNVVVLAFAAAGTIIPPDLVIGVNAAFGAVIALIAIQPPTVKTSDTVNVKTANGDPDMIVSFDDKGFAHTTVKLK